MSMVAVTTLRDPGSAEVAKEALDERGIPAEIRRLTNFTLYFGAPPAEEWEVRVPEERADDAKKVLDALTEELQQRVLAEAGVPPGEEDERGGDTLPPPELRPRKPAWAVAIALISPIPGLGFLYARAFRLGYLWLGLSLVLWASPALTGTADWMFMIVALKALDALMAPFFAARFNRKLKESHAAVA
jgi:hypothetical protein